MRRGSYAPTLECLEGRLVPASFGVPWPNPAHVTVSFAPDGTFVDGQVSNLFQTLNARLPTAVWQGEILRAFQTWAAHANLNISLVADGAQAFGTIGLKQGDARFGDIRIASVPLPRDVVALGNPYDPFIANTSGGDILLNSNDVFAVGAAPAAYDLFTIMLHEAGHALSLPDSTNPSSALFESFTQARTGLSAGDIAHVQALYGPHLQDAPGWDLPAYSTDGMNLPEGIELLATTPGYVEHSYYEASDILSADQPVNRYVMRSADIDPKLTNIMTVAIRSLDVTDPHYQVRIFDSHWKPLAATVLVNRPGSLEVSVPSVQSNQDYYVVVRPAGGKPLAEANRFEVVMDFARDAESLEPLASGTLDPQQPSVQQPLVIAQTQQVHFDLSATDWGAAASNSVVMTVVNASGRTVFTLTAASGETRTGDVLLGPGKYTLRFTRDPSGAAATPVLFELGSRAVSDPIEPRLPNPTLAPVDSASLPAGLNIFLRPLAGAVARSGTTGPATVLGPSSGSAVTSLAPNLPVSIAASVPAPLTVGAKAAAALAVLPAAVIGAPSGVQLLYMAASLRRSSEPGDFVVEEGPPPPAYAGGSLPENASPGFFEESTLVASATEAERVLPEPSTVAEHEASPLTASLPEAPIARASQHSLGAFWTFSMAAAVLSWLFWPSRSSPATLRAATPEKPN